MFLMVIPLLSVFISGLITRHKIPQEHQVKKKNNWEVLSIASANNF